MKKLFFKTIFVTSLLVVSLGFLVSPTMADTTTPTIISINPSAANILDQVEIVGTGFLDFDNTRCGDFTKCSLVTLYGSSEQTIISWTPTKIVFKIDNATSKTQTYVKLIVRINGNNALSSNTFPITINESCAADVWHCPNYGDCQPNGVQTRTCTKISTCPGANTPIPAESQSCTYVPPSCSVDTWSCGNWNSCSASGNQTRSCTKTFDCSTTDTPSPSTSQSCTPPVIYTPPVQQQPPYQPLQPSCNADIWTCEAYSSCSLSGIQSRSCTKTFDCPNVQTAPPTTNQYCEAPNRPTQQIPQSGSDEISNQDSIIKSTVKLLCPIDAQRASQGSGTIIDPSGTILTNKHVIAGTLGCLVGFINDFNDEPYFGERQIADTLKVSSNNDIAILKIRNPQNTRLTSVDITSGNSNLRLGTKITIYGYPAKFGTKVTYTSGDFSGADGSYLKTTAILEYGNSGGGSYLKDGTFIGIPSAVVKGELNALGYILSVNTIKAWIGNTNIASGGTNNNYSRVSVLEDIDLNKLGSLKLFIPSTDAKGNLSAPVKSENPQSPKVQTQPTKPQRESTIIESADSNQKITPDHNPAPAEKQQKPKDSWFKGFIFWIKNFFR